MNTGMESLGDVMNRIIDRMPDKYKARMAEIAAMSPKELAQRRVDSFNAIEGDLNQHDGFDCPECKNKGFVAALVTHRDANGNEIGWGDTTYGCKCRKTRATLLRWSKSGLGDLVKRCKFENYKTEKDWQKSAKEAAMAFIKDEKHNVFFFGGSNGCGKTTLCTAIAAHYLRHGKEVVYMSWKDDVTQLNAVVNDADEYDKLMAKYKEAEVLYIDDLWKIIRGRDGEIPFPDKGEMIRAYEIIDYRLRKSNLITIISSERYINEIIAYDQATGGRIYDLSKDGYCINIKRDPANDYRLRGMTLMG